MSPSADTVPTGPIFTAPLPWNTEETMYLTPFWTSFKTTANLPEKAYHSFKYQSPFSSPQAPGKPLGGLSMVQIVRYHKTPKAGEAMRITRIYVSQKYTCWNGRKLPTIIWNLPKDLARFDWSIPDPSNPQVQALRVYPHNHSPPDVPYSPTESNPSNTTPFFKCTLRTIPYLSFPFSNLWLPKMRIDITLVQPPLPENSQASQGEISGTADEWVKTGGYEQLSKRCKNEAGVEGKREDNFFPGLKRWNLAVVMEGKANFADGERWAVPRHML
ncbi:hypothetical protein QBC36DRAFT_389406 [Triangularia setosa]|uniref:Uncharacterized protein n=1 Tax=Triangularia setosa TaxID=2587417 RepID=A0AAN6W410_9PEZI|nr:hypothetical protein QBC36DRAFT_389406 [Podospora setosa]